jgi:hypothetical protein
MTGPSLFFAAFFAAEGGLHCNPIQGATVTTARSFAAGLMS